MGYLCIKRHLPIRPFMSYFEGTSIVIWTKEIFLLRGEGIWCLSDLKSTIPVLLLMRIQLDVDMDRCVHVIPLDLNCRSFLLYAEEFKVNKFARRSRIYILAKENIYDFQIEWWLIVTIRWNYWIYYIMNLFHNYNWVNY